MLKGAKQKGELLRKLGNVVMGNNHPLPPPTRPMKLLEKFPEVKACRNIAKKVPSVF